MLGWRLGPRSPRSPARVPGPPSPPSAGGGGGAGNARRLTIYIYISIYYMLFPSTYGERERESERDILRFQITVHTRAHGLFMVLRGVAHKIALAHGRSLRTFRTISASSAVKTTGGIDTWALQSSLDPQPVDQLTLPTASCRTFSTTK